jgi:hypothetical protein
LTGYRGLPIGLLEPVAGGSVSKTLAPWRHEDVESHAMANITPYMKVTIKQFRYKCNGRLLEEISQNNISFFLGVVSSKLFI